MGRVSNSPSPVAGVVAQRFEPLHCTSGSAGLRGPLWFVDYNLCTLFSFQGGVGPAGPPGEPGEPGPMVNVTPACRPSETQLLINGVPALHSPAARGLR